MRDVLDDILHCMPDYWRTSDGRILKIIEMSDNHIVNSLKLMKRKAIKDGEEWPDSMQAWPDSMPLTFHAMMSEVERRGLDYDPHNDVYEKVKSNKLRRRKLGEVRKIIRDRIEKLKQTRKIDLD